MKQFMNKKIGAHLSTSGGIDKAVEHAAAIGANCLQVFSGSPRMWRRTSLGQIDTNKIWSKQEKLLVSPIFTHALYLVNLASDNPEILQKSIASLKHDLSFDGYIKGSGVVVHLGSHQGRGWQAVREQLVRVMIEILQDTPENSRLLIENSAGQNGKIASDLTEVRWLLDEVRRDLPKNQAGRLGWCYDTCHGFAAGYFYGVEFSSAAKSDVDVKNILPGEKTKPELFANKKSAAEEIARLNLWADLRCIHVNDTRDDFASGRDRHDNIGEGNLPVKELGEFLRLPELADVPLITEAPGFEGNGPDAENITRIKNLLGVTDENSSGGLA